MADTPQGAPRTPKKADGVLVIGLGRFGSAIAARSVARRSTASGCRAGKGWAYSVCTLGERVSSVASGMRPWRSRGRLRLSKRSGAVSSWPPSMRRSAMLQCAPSKEPDMNVTALSRLWRA